MAAVLQGLDEKTGKDKKEICIKFSILMAQNSI
jgi:hypothetical protein